MAGWPTSTLASLVIENTFNGLRHKGRHGHHQADPSTGGSAHLYGPGHPGGDGSPAAGGVNDSLVRFSLNYSLQGAANSTDDPEEYDYDYDVSVNTFNLEELIPVALVYGLTLLLGVIGNALVIFSIARYRRMQTVTNIFLTSLASADLLLVMLCVPIKVRFYVQCTSCFDAPPPLSPPPLG